MISYEIDPTLHAGEPKPQTLDDGFSPPHHGESQPNPTHLPVEPEFGPMLPPAEPEQPKAEPPTI